MADENDDNDDATPTPSSDPVDDPDAAEPTEPGLDDTVEPEADGPDEAGIDGTTQVEADGLDETTEAEAVGADGPGSDETTEADVVEVDRPDVLDEAVGSDELGETEVDDGGSEGEAAPAGRSVAIVGGIVLGVIACLVGVVLWAGSGDDDDPADDTPAAEDSGASDDAENATDTTPTPEDTPAGEQEAAAFLSDIEPVESEHWESDETGDVTIGGETYANTVVSGPIGGCDDGAAQVVEYALGGNYTRLSGTVGLADSSPPNLGAEITFEADGAELYWRSFVQGDASRVQLDLTGVQQLTITAASVSSGDECVQAAFADLALT